MTHGHPDSASAARLRPAGFAGSARLLVCAMTLVVLVACLPPTSRGPAGSNGGADPGGSPAATPVLSAGPTGPTPRPSFVPPTPTPAPTFLVHVVGRGESLTTIARLYETTPRSIAFWNRTTYPSLDPESPDYSPNLVKVGWALLLIPRHIVDDEGNPAASPGPSGSGG